MIRKGSLSGNSIALSIAVIRADAFLRIKSLGNIERDDLIKFHRRFFQPNNIMFAVTGDITKEQAINKLRHYFGDWKAESYSCPDGSAAAKIQCRALLHQ